MAGSWFLHFDNTIAFWTTWKQKCSVSRILMFRLVNGRKQQVASTCWAADATRSRRRKGRQIWLQPSLFRVLYTYRVSREQFFKAVLRVLEERWKEFKNDPFKDWSRNSSRTQCWSGSQSDQNCFAQHWRCRQWMPIKEIGRRDCKICRAADFCFVYLSSFIGLDIFAWLQSLPDIARHCDTARIKHMCVWWILRLLFSVCQDQPHLHFRAILCPCNLRCAMPLG